MALYDGFFDAVKDENDGTYDRAYNSGDFTGYFDKLAGSGVCVSNDPDSFKVRFTGGNAVVSPGYLFIQGYWLRNDADYSIPVTGSATLAVAAHLDLGKRTVELMARSVAQAYPDSLVLAMVNPAAGSAEDTRYNTDICGVIEGAGELSSKVEWAINYIDNEIEGRLDAAQAQVDAQAAVLDTKIAQVEAQIARITPPPVGTIQYSAAQNVGAEWLPCDGRFVGDTEYPELVAALGKLTPSSDKFKLISDGQVGPQISNGVIYGGKMWVYSYSTQKLYGVDLDGQNSVKEIPVSSADVAFHSFAPPTSAQPIALSIVESDIGAKTKLFLAQWPDKMFCADFSGSETSLSVAKPCRGISGSPETCVPYVARHLEGGKEWFHCVTTGNLENGAWNEVKWKDGDEEATLFSYYDDRVTDVTKYGRYSTQRAAYSRKNKNEAVLVRYSRDGTVITSEPKKIFTRSGSQNYAENNLSVPNPLNIAGKDSVVFEISKTGLMVIPLTSLDPPRTIQFRSAALPNAARIFVDGGAYLWGKDIFMIFVGTGLLFSRDMTPNSFGYLDTTSILGTITQFGYLDYSEDEGTLYILGQDTANRVKVGKIVLNTLYDYANNGAWLPTLAADGVPAYIKAKEAQT